MGLEVAQMALMAGADDAGSTMMEENVVSASGTTKMSATKKNFSIQLLEQVSNLLNAIVITII